MFGNILREIICTMFWKMQLQLQKQIILNVIFIIIVCIKLRWKCVLLAEKGWILTVCSFLN